MTLGPDRWTMRRWAMLEPDKGDGTGGGGTGEEAKPDAKPGDGDKGGEEKKSDPPPVTEKTASVKIADGGSKIVIDGVEYLVQSKVNELVGTAREEGRTKGKDELAEEARQEALKKQGDFEKLYNEEKAAREKAEGEREAEKLKAARQTAGAKFNLPAELIDRLVGETEKELTADAERLSKLVGERKPVDTEGGQGGRNRKKEDAGAGGDGSTPQRRYAFQKEGDVNWRTGEKIGTKK